MATSLAGCTVARALSAFQRSPQAPRATAFIAGSVLSTPAMTRAVRAAPGRPILIRWAIGAPSASGHRAHELSRTSRSESQRSCCYPVRVPQLRPGKHPALPGWPSRTRGILAASVECYASDVRALTRTTDRWRIVVPLWVASHAGGRGRGAPRPTRSRSIFFQYRRAWGPAGGRAPCPGGYPVDDTPSTRGINDGEVRV